MNLSAGFEASGLASMPGKWKQLTGALPIDKIQLFARQRYHEINFSSGIFVKDVGA